MNDNKLQEERDISKSETQLNCSNYAAVRYCLETTKHQQYFNINKKYIIFSAFISH